MNHFTFDNIFFCIFLLSRGGSGDTFAATGPDDQNLILVYIVSSKPFSDGKSVEISRTGPGPRFTKILPYVKFLKLP